MTQKHATTSAPILDTLTQRWSPRAFDSNHQLPEGALRSVFEAARWSPSAANTQPWRFIIARRGSESFTKIAQTLLGFNKAWAVDAAALIVNLAVVNDAEGKPLRWAEYDLGQAVAHLTVQAQSEGLYVHQMGGFNADALRTSLNIPTELSPVSVMTIGELGSPEQLPEPLQERELAPRERLAIEDIVFIND